jgi:hypothetical protein
MPTDEQESVVSDSEVEWSFDEKDKLQSLERVEFPEDIIIEKDFQENELILLQQGITNTHHSDMFHSTYVYAVTDFFLCFGQIPR